MRIPSVTLTLKGEGDRFLRKRESSDGASFDKLRTNDLLVYLPLLALKGEGTFILMTDRCE